MSYKNNIDLNNLPQHVAIIMDGNGRWAKLRGEHRGYGHQQGVVAVRQIVETATALGIKYLTLYTFSTENWNRPKEEVEALMALFLKSLEEELFTKNNVGFRVIGDRARLPQAVQDAILHLEQVTAKNDRMCLVLALSYSARWEMTTAVKQIAAKVAAGALRPEEITEELFAQHLATNFMPDPALLIRTGGEQRLSNYLLWQSAYTEFYFTDTYWPDFDDEAFYKAIVSYQSKERRFGKTSEQLQTLRADGLCHDTED